MNNPNILFDPDGRHPMLSRALQAAQRLANSPAARTARKYAGSAWNYIKKDWQGFTQKAKNLPNKMKYDFSRAVNAIQNLFNKGTNFNNNSNIKGLNLGELQRMNVGGEVKLGLKSLQEAGKSLAEGGAGVQGVKIPGNGKLMKLIEAGGGQVKVIIQKIVDGKITETLSTVGDPNKLGIKNASELIKKGAGYANHFIGEVK